MKLIDLLVQELPKRGGWIKGANAIFQDYDGELRTKGKSSTLTDIRLALCDHFRLRHHPSSDLPNHYFVTREQYESALAASKTPAWDGKGLPPVGSVVEAKSEDFEGEWISIKVVYVHGGEVIGIVQSDNEYLNDRMEKFSAGYNGADFRPIQSEADKKRAAATESMSVEWRKVAGEVYRNGTPIGIYDGIYSAIAAGKIPGVKLDD